MGAAIGAAIGVAAGPPGVVVGLAVGGLCGLGGYLLGNWLGKKAKDRITKVRADRAWPDVRKAIDGFVRDTCRDLERQLKDLHDVITAGLEEWEQAQVSRYEEERESRRSAMAASVEEKREARAQLQNDAEVLRRYGRCLGDLT